MLKERLPTRTKQRLILASRATDRSLRESAYINLAERESLLQRGTTSVELVTGLLFLVAHKLMSVPTALIAGAEELFRSR